MPIERILQRMQLNAAAVEASALDIIETEVRDALPSMNAIALSLCCGIVLMAAWIV